MLQDFKIFLQIFNIYLYPSGQHSPEGKHTLVLVYVNNMIVTGDDK